MERFRWSFLALVVGGLSGTAMAQPAAPAPLPPAVDDPYAAPPPHRPSQPYGPALPDASPPDEPAPPETSSPYGPALPDGPSLPQAQPYGPALPPTQPYGPALPPTQPYGPALPPTQPYGPALPPTQPYGPARPPTQPYGPSLPAATGSPRRVADATLKPFLEHRVPEELASEGILLSRRNLALELEPVGASWIVSLTDLSTQLVTASTLIDALPDDREAAVAALTQVAAALTAQPFRIAPPGLATPSLADVIDEQIARRARAARERRAKAERLFADIKLDLGNEVQVFAERKGKTPSGASAKASISITERWVPYEGGKKLDIEAFYAELGRPELARSYRNRRTLKYVSWVGGAGLIGGAAIWLASDVADHAQCTREGYSPEVCPKNVNAGPLILGAIGAATSLIGIYLHGHPQPISHREAMRLVDNYNAKLRSELKLADRAPVLREVRLAPYAAADGGGGGGLTLAGQF